MQQYDFIKKDDIRGFRPVMKDGKWGLIDKDNTGIILCILDEEPKLFNGFILCKHEGKIGLLNGEGEYVVPMKYDKIRKDEDYMVAFKGERIGLIDFSGKVILDAIYDDVSCRNNGFFIKEGLLWGFADREGNVVVPPQYDKVIVNDDRYALIFSNDKQAIYDMKNNKQICVAKYHGIGVLSCGLFRVEIGDKCGYMDETGKEIVPCTYEDGSNFSNGYAAVFNGKHYAYIDTKGKEVTKFIYDSARPANNSFVAEVVYKGDAGTVVLEGRH